MNARWLGASSLAVGFLLLATILAGLGSDIETTIPDPSRIVQAASGSNARPQIDLSNVDLSNVDLSHVDLSQADFSDVDLSNVDLSKLDLSQLDTRGRDPIDMTGLDLSGLDLSNVDLSRVDLSNVDLSGLDLSGVDLSRMGIEGLDWSKADLSKARLDGARLSGLDLRAAGARGGDFDGASPRDVGPIDWSRVRLSDVTLEGVDLSRVDLSRVGLPAGALQGADLSNVRLEGLDLTGFDLERAVGARGVEVSGPSRDAALDGLDLGRLDLGKASGAGTALSNVGWGAAAAGALAAMLDWDSVDLRTLDGSTLDPSNVDPNTFPLHTLPWHRAAGMDSRTARRLDTSTLDASTLPLDTLDLSTLPLHDLRWDPDGSSSASFLAGNAGGLTGQTAGAVPRAGAGPTSFAPDRNGAGGQTVCYEVFAPGVACHKRLIVFGDVGAGHTLRRDTRDLEPVAVVSRAMGTRFQGTFDVDLRPDTPTPIYSVSPHQRLVGFWLEPDVRAQILRDAQDGWYVQSAADGVHTLTIVLAVPDGYHDGIPAGLRLSSARLGVTAPRLPADVAAPVNGFLASRPWAGSDDLSAALLDLQAFFQGFAEGQIAPDEPDFFQALVDAKVGCCRHRAQGFVESVQALGIPARFVANEAHAFAEVLLPGGWVLVDLGGCGTYRLVDGGPMHAPLQDATDRLVDRRDAADPPRVQGDATATTITGWPDRFRKGGLAPVDILVQSADGGLAGAPVTLYLNTSKATPGREVARGRTGDDGTLRLEFAVPADLPPGDYQLVAHHRGHAAQGRTYLASWSDPPMAIVAPATIRLDAPDAVGVGTPVRVVARLTDEAGAPLAGRNLDLEVHRASVPVMAQTVVTDAAGEAVFLPTLEAGTYGIVAAFDGDAHSDGASAQRTVRVAQAGFVADRVPLIVHRGQDADVVGRVMDGGAPAAGAAVTLRGLGGSWSGVSDADGRVHVIVPIRPGESLGPAHLEVLAPGLGGAAGRVDVEVRARTVLEVHWGPHYVPGAPVPVRLRAVDEAGVGLAGLAAVVHGDTAPGNTTDAQGWTTIVAPLASAADGRLPPTQSLRAAVAATTRSEAAEATIQAIPLHAATRLAATARGDGARLDARLAVTDANGRAVPDVASGQATGLDAIVIEVNGVAHALPWDSDRWSLDVPGNAGDVLTVHVRSDLPGHGEHATVEVRPVGASLPWAWIAVGAVAVLAAAFAAYVLIRRFTGAPSMPAWIDRRPAARVELALPGRPAGLPLAVAPGRAVVLHVRVTMAAANPEGKPGGQAVTAGPNGAAAVPATVRWRLGGRTGTLAMGPDGSALQLPAMAPGDHRLDLRVDAKGLRPTAVAVRLHAAAWSQHVLRAYADLCTVAQRLGGPLPEGHTPRMLERHLRPHTDAAGLEAAIVTYERAAFSPFEVQEGDWMPMAAFVRKAGAP